MGFGMIFIILAVVAVVLLLQDSGSRGIFNAGETVTAESPLDILKRRYARGEIDTAEYEALKRDLA